MTGPGRRAGLQRLLLAGVLAGAAHASQAQDAARGEKAFEECHACHSADGVTNDVGPGLRGIIGRKAGERDDFRYSPAMKRSGITWTPETLEAFIADPQKLVPANRMPYAGQPDAQVRADLIQYLLQKFR